MSNMQGIRLFLLAITLVFSTQTVLSQFVKTSKNKPAPIAELIDEFPGNSNSEDKSARTDNLMIRLHNKPGSKGVVIFYCGKKCYYGEYEAQVRGMIKTKLIPRGYDSRSLIFINGGYSEKSRIQFWLVPKGAGLPVPKSDIKFEDVKFKGKAKHKMFAWDCCDIP